MKTMDEINAEISNLEQSYAVLKRQGKKGRSDLRLKAKVLCWVIGRVWEKHKSKFTG